jgi:hypothetical protein
MATAARSAPSVAATFPAPGVAASVHRALLAALATDASAPAAWAGSDRHAGSRPIRPSARPLPASETAAPTRKRVV